MNRTISHRLPNLKNGIRKAFLLPSEENYQKIYQTINKNIFNKIDKQKDQSDNIAAQRAANIIFSVSGRNDGLMIFDIPLNFGDIGNRIHTLCIFF